MKKKITTVVLLLVFGAIAITGGTLAYFTDTEEATNTFVMGSVAITLNENFEQGATLVPGEASAITKEVTITNTGTNNAYVWYEYLLPNALDPGYSEKVLIVKNAQGTKWLHNEPISSNVANGLAGTEVKGTVTYNVYVSFYNDILSSGSTTERGMESVYLNAKLDQKGGYYTLGNTNITGKFTDDNGKVNIIVRAYAIQADGITDVDNNGHVDVVDAYKVYHSQV